jgi:rhodanese-related sulfurtransferase
MNCHTLPALLAGLLLIGCKADLTGLETVTVDQLASLLAGQSDVAVCDANNARTRSRYGIIPGARLLTSYRDYAAGELPDDPTRKLVFYCHSEMCSAAADAARTALLAGHSDVSVLAVGIEGWRDAGQPVESAPAEPLS